MFNRTLTTILAFTCLFSFSNGDDKYVSFKDLKKIPDGMNIVHNGEGATAVVAIHGFYPIYWVEIHHEWVQPFNYLVENNINTFFYKNNWNECTGNVSNDFEEVLQHLIVQDPEFDN